jgi:bzd-type benzoyl-CoA reductase N subunit
MVEAVKKLREIATTFPKDNPYIKEWKEQGKKVVGWICTHSPEEVIYAAGMLPYRIVGDPREDIVGAEAYLFANTCFLVRSIVQLGLNKEYEVLDGLLFVNTCDHMRRLFDVWRHYLPTPPYHILAVPHKISEVSLEFFEGEVNKLKNRMEEISGREITDDALRNAIELYNKSRSLLRQLYELRKQDPPPVGAAEVIDIVRAAMKIPKDQFNNLLEEALKEISQRKTLSEKKVRLMVVGSYLDNPQFMQAIEDLGASVVVDQICMGTRYFWDSIDPTLPPIQGIARRYLRRTPCARIRPIAMRLKHIMDLVKEFSVDGVIYEIIKYCDLYGYDKPVFRRELEQAGIPVVELDLEYGGGRISMGQIRTRCQAFIEMLERKKLAQVA